MKSFELIDDIGSFLELSDAWKDLESRSGCHVFQSHAFLASWLGSVGRTRPVSLAIVTYWEGTVLQGVFPACVVTRSKIRFLTWLGGLHLIDYGDILLDPGSGFTAEQFAEEALSRIRKDVSFHIAYFQNIRHDARAYPYFSRSFLPYRTEQAPFIRLTGRFEDFENSLRKKLRSDTQRQIKRLEELGTLKFKHVGPNDPDLEPVLHAFFIQKKQQYVSTGVQGVLLFPEYEEFYRRDALQHPAVLLSCLKLNEDVIAVHYGYLYKKRLYYLMPSYCDHYAKYSPGRILTYYLIRDCYARNAAVFDFCLGGEPYKYEWTNEEAQETIFVDRTLVGRLFLVLMRMRERIIRFRRSLQKRR